jgi:hypothetical protein
MELLGKKTAAAGSLSLVSNPETAFAGSRS